MRRHKIPTMQIAMNIVVTKKHLHVHVEDRLRHLLLRRMHFIAETLIRRLRLVPHLAEDILHDRSVDPGFGQDAWGDEMRKDLRKLDNLLSLEVPVEELKVVRLPGKVDLPPERQVESVLVKRLRRLQENFPDPVENIEEQSGVVVRLVHNLGVSDLDCNFSLAPFERKLGFQDPFVNLCNGSTGNRNLVELIEDLLNGPSKRFFDGPSRVFEIVRRSIVPQPRQGPDDIRRKQVWTH
mmetsp:Transcript_9525/g.21630  ORF Transcript_9525/g.21630 Transcript_9525/m.21630 type:complete len:238 (+) Transcript_9525:474-1187(+)